MILFKGKKLQNSNDLKTARQKIARKAIDGDKLEIVYPKGTTIVYKTQVDDFVGVGYGYKPGTGGKKRRKERKIKNVRLTLVDVVTAE